MDDGDQAVAGSESSSGDTDIRTFLIADVRGYTLFTQERGDEAAGKLAAKFAELAREAVEARGGTLLELRGDEALCVFGSPRQAIRVAVDLQERFVEETLATPELPLTVGIGLDAGEAVAVEGGYRGGALNLAARLCGQARAGEILASREVAHLARRVEGVRYEERGTLNLKGLAEPVHVVRVVPEQFDAVARLSSFAAAPPPTPTPVWRRRGVVIPVVLAIALIAVSIPFLGSDGGDLDVATNSVTRFSPEDGSVGLETQLGERVGASAIGFGSAWIAEPDRARVVRLDLEDGEVSDTVTVGASPADIVVGAGSVWVTNGGDNTISRIDPETNEVSQRLEVGAGPAGIAFGDGALWVASTIRGELVRIDPSGDLRSVELSGQPADVAFTPEGVWVTFAPAGIARVDPDDLSVTFVQTVGNGPTAIASGFGSIWVANHIDGTVSRLEPSTGRELTKIPVGDGPNALEVAAGAVWVGNEFDGSLSEIDPTSGRVERRIPLGSAVASLTANGDDLWLAVGASPRQHRGGTFTMSSGAQDFASMDPALVYGGFGWQVLSFTNDGLLAFKKTSGPDGATLVPDLASAFPQVSPDGLTYRFPLRSGIRYSTGEPVRPEDFRHGLERALTLSPDARTLFGAIVGARACADEAACDLTDSIETDENAVTIHLDRSDTDLPFKLALPFAFPLPASIPAEDQGLDPVPATGPYMVAELRPNGIELVRNPAFREWSAAAQPDGFVDEISWTFGEEPERAFAQLEAGDLDSITDPTPDAVASLQAAHPDQVVLSPQATTFFVGFELDREPVGDVRIRQALNLAIDREHVAVLLGGPTSQRPTCQILPPNFQGYEPFCPYTIDPQAGVWSAPDVPRARSLIEDAGAVGAAVTVWVTDQPGYLPPGSMETMRYVTKVLNDLGLEAQLETIRDGDRYFDTIYRPVSPPNAPEVYMSGWATDYSRAGDFIDQFRCGSGSNSSGFCDERIDRRIDEARRLQATDPAGANREWIAIEHELVEEAIWGPLTNPASAYVFSARTENIQVHPQWGILLSRLWVR